MCDNTSKVGMTCLFLSFCAKDISLPHNMPLLTLGGACAASVTVVVLCMCVCVCLSIHGS